MSTRTVDFVSYVAGAVLAVGASMASAHDGRSHGGGHGGFRGPPAVHAPLGAPGARFHGAVRMAPRAPVYSHSYPRYATPYGWGRSPHYAYRHYGYPRYVYPQAGSHYYWRGGYWRGSYWPRAYFYSGCPLFLAALPLWYATYWYADTPYYYVNNVYYVRSDDDDGYVLANPPPVADGDDTSVSSGEVYAYPRNGQSEREQADDKRECRDWAADHVDDETDERAPVDSDDYRRAVIACLEGRGYTAK